MLFKMKNKSIVAATMSLTLLLSACSSAPVKTSGTDSTTNEAATSQATGTTQAEPDENGTRTISTVMGDVEVPVNPQRVVVDYIIGDVVALGVVPLGVAKSEEGGENTAFADKITESVKIENWDMEPEEIMALDPDLIILSFSQKPYEDLSKIAPTVYVPYGDMTTKDRIQFIGNVLNKNEEAQAVLNAYEEKISDAKQKLHDAGLSETTVTIGQFNDKENYIAGAKHAVGVMAYNDLGLKVPQKVQTDIIDVNEYWGHISMEVLESYCGDNIISLGEIPSSVSDNAVWKSIPAVINSNILYADTSITWYTDIMSSSALIDFIVDGLIHLNVSQ
jgi:iron complex transport system substrate-binding protein